MKALPKSWCGFTIYMVLIINGLVSCKKEAAVEPVVTTPVVRLISPTSSTLLQDSVLVEVEATDDKGIVKVEVYTDNQIPQGGTLVVIPYKYTWDISGLPDSSAHTVFAKAYDADGNVSTTPVLTLVLFKFAPSNLTATAVSDTLVRLTWKDNSRKEDGFEIERKTGTGDFVLVKTVASNMTTASIDGAYRTTETTWFRVRAFSLTDKSKYSNTVNVSITFAAPTNLTAVPTSDTSVTLSWKDNSSFETGFVIERSTDGVNFLLVDSAGANIVTKSVVGAYRVNTTYSFRVRAKSVHNYSGYSNVAAGSWRADVSLVSVSGGTFQMGSTTGYSNEKPVHPVTLGAFYIDKTEVTYEKWNSVRNWGLTHGYTGLATGRNGYTGTTNHPVTEVSWYDMLKWCNARSEKDGLTPVYYTSSTLTTVYRTGQLDLASDAVKWTESGYRLPTEAEWEFAAKGGTKSQGYIYSGSNTIDGVAWYYSNSGFNTHPVSTKGANELGIYDMNGNVSEWCWDWYGTYGASSQTDPKGPTSGSGRVLRGGLFLTLVTDCRVTGRDGPSYALSGLSYYVGFRCVQE